MLKNQTNQKKQKTKILPRHRKISPLIIGCTVSATAVVVFLILVFVNALTAEAQINLITTWKMPEFKSLDNLPNLEYGDYAVAIDGVVARSGNSTQQPTASTTKMILGLAIMEVKPFGVGEEGEKITITSDMYKRYLWYTKNGGSVTKVSIGEEISEYDALMAVFLSSSNNMADALAEWAFGSLDGYQKYATEMIEKWGLENTVIGVDASGFDSSTKSTANDLAIIGQKVLSNNVLREIVGTKEHEIPVAGELTNTNKILGINRIAGIKTGWIGDVSGYCLASGYFEGDHIVSIALLGAPTRLQSFNDSLEIAVNIQNDVQEHTAIVAGQVVGYYDSWWTGQVKITADEDLKVIGWDGVEKDYKLDMSEKTGTLNMMIGGTEYKVNVTADEYMTGPSFGERLSHSFGWSNDRKINESENDINDGLNETTSNDSANDSEKNDDSKNELFVAEKIEENAESDNSTINKNTNTDPPSTGNCTLGYGYLMLINPNFTVDIGYIDGRRSQLVSVSSLYGIREGNPYNGDNLLDAEAATHLNEMVKAYEADYPGHTFETRSCYRARGTTCGRLCAATGASDHHTGLTCDLLDPVYGTTLDTDYYDQHIDWQWLYANSYKYGFIDRFPEEWAGGSMSEPLNVDENGSTGLFETWHYRYVGVGPATEIATGKYNGGRYDSLEHYLKARGMVTDLKNGKCN